MTQMTKIVDMKDREIEVTLLAENVAKHVTKTGNVDYRVREKTTGIWKFAHQARFDGLVKRFGSVEAVSDRYLSPLEIAVVTAVDGHPLKYLVEKQPRVTKKTKVKAEKPAKTSSKKVSVEPVVTSSEPVRDAKGRFSKKPELVMA